MAGWNFNVGEIIKVRNEETDSKNGIFNFFRNIISSNVSSEAYQNVLYFNTIWNLNSKQNFQKFLISINYEILYDSREVFYSSSSLSTDIENATLNMIIECDKLTKSLKKIWNGVKASLTQLREIICQLGSDKCTHSLSRQSFTLDMLRLLKHSRKITMQ